MTEFTVAVLLRDMYNNNAFYLVGFTCRCGGLFCSIHRYSDKHNCDFDYKELGAEEIRKSNPVIIAKKVQKI